MAGENFDVSFAGQDNGSYEVTYPRLESGDLGLINQTDSIGVSADEYLNISFDQRFREENPILSLSKDGDGWPKSVNLDDLEPQEQEGVRVLALLYAEAALRVTKNGLQTQIAEVSENLRDALENLLGAPFDCRKEDYAVGDADSPINFRISSRLESLNLGKLSEAFGDRDGGRFLERNGFGLKGKIDDSLFGGLSSEELRAGRHRNHSVGMNIFVQGKGDLNSIGELRISEYYEVGQGDPIESGAYLGISNSYNGDINYRDLTPEQQEAASNFVKIYAQAFVDTADKDFHERVQTFSQLLDEATGNEVMYKSITNPDTGKTRYWALDVSNNGDYASFKPEDLANAVQQPEKKRV